MDVKFGKRFSKDIDSIENLPEIKKLLLKLIQKKRYLSPISITHSFCRVASSFALNPMA